MVLIKISSINTIYYTDILFFLSKEIYTNVNYDTINSSTVNREFSFKNLWNDKIYTNHGNNKNIKSLINFNLDLVIMNLTILYKNKNYIRE